MTLVDAIWADVVALWRPALLNIYFAFASIPLGFVLAIFVALGKASRNRPLSRLASGYIYAFRGSPFFIQLFMFYSLMLALNLSVWKPLGIDTIVLNPLVLGPAILALNTTAYSAEIFHGALMAVPRGELEAARAFGMTRAQIFRRITWPNMLRLAWPAYTNEVVFLFHATALVYFTLPVIDGNADLMNKAGELFERDYNALLHYSVTAMFFLAISLCIFLIFGTFYRHLMRHTEGPKRIKFTTARL
jgi:polar amino acid transport system permease protein